MDNSITYLEDYKIENRKLPWGKINGRQIDLEQILGPFGTFGWVGPSHSEEDRKIVAEGGRLDRLLLIFEMSPISTISMGEKHLATSWMKMALFTWLSALPGENDTEKRWIWQIKPAIYEGPVTIKVKRNRVSSRLSRESSRLSREGVPIDGTMGTWAMLSPDGEEGFCIIKERATEPFLFDLGELVEYGEQMVQLKGGGMGVAEWNMGPGID
ncbi:hypothetical protein CLAIMM_03132 [Cladophialophora immunda]|nr:hypothetical protein CLAIMM_03132 [Cladophialophora immunda]